MPPRSARPKELQPPAHERLDFQYVNRLKDFYGDLADLGKCGPAHIALLEVLLEDDAHPERASARPFVGAGDGLDRIGAMLGQFSRQGHAGMFRSTLDTLLSRVKFAAALPAAMQQAWSALHRQAHLLEGKSSPSGKWLDAVRPALSPLSADEQLDFLEKVLAGYEPQTTAYPSDNTVRGLIYLSVDMPAQRLGPMLSAYARKKCFQTIPGIGIRNERHGNACLWALIHMPDGAGVAYLARLLNRIKYPSVKKKINAALNEAASAAGLSRGALDELSVPSHDLVGGTAEIAIGEAGGAALLTIAGTASVDIRWRGAEGKVTASIPASLKADAAGIKAARETAKEIEADLSAQVARLQRIFLEDRSWTYAEWRERYADHPLMQALVKRLIWNVRHGDVRRSAVLVDGNLEDATGRPVEVGDAATVTLWHPIDCAVAEVLAWRQRLGELGITQPFKQAHREVYVVTDAERTTALYSNRYAGHILKQHQMMTLARINNWNVTHRIWADVSNDEPTHIVIPAHGIVAEFWTAGAGGDDPEVSDSQAYLYLTTDQVRFYRIADMAELAAPLTAFGPSRGQNLELASVPPIVFSEVMRHCDLFTGVASVANDPNWHNAGANAEHPNQWRRTEGNPYWEAQSVGDLGEAAKTRREALQAILPALKIADRCHIDGRFLVVRGTRRGYKIHMGSGNILMQPNDRYLCIVKGKDNPEDSAGRLPFEGDQMLSLILSKAFLLVDDDKITDLSIVKQIIGD